MTPESEKMPVILTKEEYLILADEEPGTPEHDEIMLKHRLSVDAGTVDVIVDGRAFKMSTKQEDFGTEDLAEAA